MSEEEKQQVIRLALDEDKMTLICREIFIRSQSGENPPSADGLYLCPKTRTQRISRQSKGSP